MTPLIQSDTTDTIHYGAGPVDAVIFMETDLHILRQSHISGVCRSAGGVNITSGPVLVQFSLMDCPGFGGFVYDAYTGWNSISRILLEEIIPRKSVCLYL